MKEEELSARQREHLWERLEIASRRERSLLNKTAVEYIDAFLGKENASSQEAHYIRFLVHYEVPFPSVHVELQALRGYSDKQRKIIFEMVGPLNEFLHEIHGAGPPRTDEDEKLLIGVVKELSADMRRAVRAGLKDNSLVRKFVMFATRGFARSLRGRFPALSKGRRTPLKEPSGERKDPSVISPLEIRNVALEYKKKGRSFGMLYRYLKKSHGYKKTRQALNSYLVRQGIPFPRNRKTQASS